MDTNCSSCQEIVTFEEALDKRASDLVERVNSLCADVRSRNKERWENFAYWVNLPFIGNVIYGLFRAPAGLESDPDYNNSDWYRPEGLAIEEQARLLEKMKANHMGHWGNELVTPGLVGDPAGHYTPSGKIKRSEEYDPGFTHYKRDISRPAETYFVHIPDKYDFTSAAGVGKMEEGVFVLDVNSKSVVPLNQCDWSWTALRDTADNLLKKLFANFARTGCIYTLRP